MAFCLEQEIDGARSRANAVRRKNGQLLQAYAADPSAGSARERREAEYLTAAATDYLARFDQALGTDLALPQQCREAAVDLRHDRSLNVGTQSSSIMRPGDETALWLKPNVEFVAIVHDRALIEEALAARRRHAEALQTQREAASKSVPLPQTPAEPVKADPKLNPDDGIAGDAARRAAIAAALKGQGR